MTLRPAFLTEWYRRAVFIRPTMPITGGINAPPSFVVQADITPVMGVSAAGIGHAFDGFHELGHDLGPFRVAEVQAVSGGHGQGADHR